MGGATNIASRFTGSWRITEMDNWPQTYVELVGYAYFKFGDEDQGEMSFGAVKGWLDVRYSLSDGKPTAEFSWQGYDEGDSASGRGWLQIRPAGDAKGYIFIHCGEESAVICEKQ